MLPVLNKFSFSSFSGSRASMLLLLIPPSLQKSELSYFLWETGGEKERDMQSPWPTWAEQFCSAHARRRERGDTEHYQEYTYAAWVMVSLLTGWKLALLIFHRLSCGTGSERRTTEGASPPHPPSVSGWSRHVAIQRHIFSSIWSRNELRAELIINLKVVPYKQLFYWKLQLNKPAADASTIFKQRRCSWDLF